MAKEYGEKSLFEKVFGGKLFPKGTGGILPKYDEGLKKEKSEVSSKSTKKKVPLFESPKKKNIRLSTESGKANRKASDMMKAAEKKFDMEKSNIAKKFMQGAIKEAEASAKRDAAKTKPGKGKDLRDKRKVKQAPKGTKFAEQKAPKMSLREKLTGFKTQKAFEDARDKRRLKKRIATITKTLEKKDSKILKERLAKLKAQL
jgi:hypothetical protein